MKKASKESKITELSNLTVIDRKVCTTVDIELSRITLIGGRINDTVPGTAEAAGQALKSFTKVRPILPNTQRSSAWMSEQYNRAVKSADVEMFLQILQIADNRIEKVDIDLNLGVRIFRIGNSESLVEADHFIQRLAQVAFSLINHKFLAIDQIENGLYGGSYEDLWIHLFEISSLLKAQIIATTHSTKMIEAFAKVAQSLNTDPYYSPSSYVELRRRKTGELVATSINADTVLYALKRSEDIQGGCTIGND